MFQPIPGMGDIFQYGMDEFSEGITGHSQKKEIQKRLIKDNVSFVEKSKRRL
jgi:hypothetical protein